MEVHKLEERQCKHNETYMEGTNTLTTAMVVKKDINICRFFFRLTAISIVLSAPASLICQRCITDFDTCFCLSNSVWTNLNSSQLKTHQILPTLQIRANLPERPVPHRLRHKTSHIFLNCTFYRFPLQTQFWDSVASVLDRMDLKVCLYVRNLAADPLIRQALKSPVAGNSSHFTGRLSSLG